MNRLILLTVFLFAAVSCNSDDSPAANAVKPVPAFFNIDGDELYATFDGFPGFILNAVKSNPDSFLVLMHQILSFDRDTYVIVDKEHFLSSAYEPDDLVSLNNYPLSRNRNDLRLRSVVMPDLMAMDTASDNIGLRLVYSSSYRSFAYQESVYNRHVNQMGQEAADRVSARPGSSQHQLGTTVDFGSITDEFADTPEGKWLLDHGWEFGFSLSYPDGYEEVTGYRHEIWHYRWIGRPAAAECHYFFNDIQHYFLSYLDKNWDFFYSRLK